MRLLIIFILLSGTAQVAHASDLFIPTLDGNWVSMKMAGIADEYKGWSFQFWRNKKNGDILTLAIDPIRRKLDSYGDLDRAMDFASSAYPEWQNVAGFPNWRSEKLNYDPGFLKLQKTKFTYRPIDGTEPTEHAAIEYCLVNGDDDFPMMANGFVINSQESTYYVQLTSKRPILDSLPREVVEQLQKHPHK